MFGRRLWRSLGFCAHRLVSRLQGPSRLLAMAWPDAAFDNADGVTRMFSVDLPRVPLFVRTCPMLRLFVSSTSPSRRTWPNLRRAILVRESLSFAEFGEAITRLHEEKMGIRWAFNSMNSTSDYRSGRPTVSVRAAGLRRSGTRTGGSNMALRPTSVNVVLMLQKIDVHHKMAMVITAAGSPQQSSRADPFVSRRSRGAQGSEYPGLSLKDTLCLQFSGLLIASGFWPPPEGYARHRIIATTKGSLEFEVVTKALQTLWDEQLLGRRGGWTSKGHEAMVHEAEWERPDWLEADGSWDAWDE